MKGATTPRSEPPSRAMLKVGKNNAALIARVTEKIYLDQRHRQKGPNRSMICEEGQQLISTPVELTWPGWMTSHRCGHASENDRAPGGLSLPRSSLESCTVTTTRTFSHPSTEVAKCEPLALSRRWAKYSPLIG